VVPASPTEAGDASGDRHRNSMTNVTLRPA
jgi:hypothetical protein